MTTSTTEYVVVAGGLCRGTLTSKKAALDLAKKYEKQRPRAVPGVCVYAVTKKITKVKL